MFCFIILMYNGFLYVNMCYSHSWDLRLLSTSELQGTRHKSRIEALKPML